MCDDNNNNVSHYYIIIIYAFAYAKENQLLKC